MPLATQAAVEGLLDIFKMGSSGTHGKSGDAERDPQVGFSGGALLTDASEAKLPQHKRLQKVCARTHHLTSSFSYSAFRNPPPQPLVVVGNASHYFSVIRVFHQFGSVAHFCRAIKPILVSVKSYGMRNCSQYPDADAPLTLRGRNDALIVFGEIEASQNMHLWAARVLKPAPNVELWRKEPPLELLRA